MIDADVKMDAPMTATYDVPGLGFGVDYRLDPSMTTLDHIIPATGRYAVSAIREYERDIRSRLYRPRAGFLGLGGLVPPTVGDNIIGGIDEGLYPGWQSNAVTNMYGILDTLNVLDAACSSEDAEPDLTVLGTSAYRELVAGTQVQQRCWMISGSAKLLTLNSGGVYHDAHCAPHGGYVMTTDDFGFHAPAPRIGTEVTPDGRIRFRIRRDEQLFAYRRYRSGAIVPHLPSTLNWRAVRPGRSRLTRV